MATVQLDRIPDFNELGLAALNKILQEIERQLQNAQTDADTANAVAGEYTSVFQAFGGDGSDGAEVVSAGTNFSAIDSAVAGFAEFTSLNISNTLTIDTKYAFIGVSGTCTISGTITADGQGRAGGTEGTGAQDGGGGRNAQDRGSTAANVDTVGEAYTADTDQPIDSATAGLQQHPMDFCLTGAGGGGAGNAANTKNGGAGGGAGSYGGQGGSGIDGTGSAAVATSSTKIALLSGGGAGDDTTRGYSNFTPGMFMFLGAGGGGGAGEGASNGGGGGAGGGMIYIECDTLVLTGTITADGDAGTSTVGTSGGAGGGGGGGLILVRAKTVTTHTGTLTVDAGAGGTASGLADPGGAGAAGYMDVIAVE